MNDVPAAMELLLTKIEQQFTFIDVGARWGAQEKWAAFGDRASMVCFEPDKEECDRLTAASPWNVRYLPIGLADVEGEQTLYVTTEPACSSIFPPVRALYEKYPSLSIIRPEKEVKIFCRRLDDVLAEHRIANVAAIKVDTQGSELLILKGGTEALKACALVDIEVEFNPLYAGQALFCDVDRFMRDNGFVLWRLDNLVHYAPETVKAAEYDFLIASDPAPQIFARSPNGQTFWAQAQYVRAEYPRTGAETMNEAAAVRAAAIVANYGHWDLAIELIRKTEDDNLLSSLRGLLGLA